MIPGKEKIKREKDFLSADASSEIFGGNPISEENSLPTAGKPAAVPRSLPGDMERLIR